MSGTPAFGRSALRSTHRAALGTLCLVFAASIDAGAPAAQGAPQQGGQGHTAMRQSFGPRLRMRGRFMMMGMRSDPAARLLDEQSLLQLSGAQVTQLIALHESTRKQSRAVLDQMRAMFPRPQGQAQGQAQGQTPEQRPQLTQQQRDNLATLIDSLRTIRWRATSAADSVLTADQRHMAVRLAMARRSRMRGGRGFGGGMMQRMGPGGRGGPEGGMGMRRTPNDSGPD